MIEYLIKPFFQYLPTDLSAIAAAMVWGQKQYLTSTQYQVWRTTGLLHLLVLSGQNITLLVNFLQIFTKRLGLRWQLLITVLVALFYLVIFGTEAPIVRASVMAILSSLVIFEQTTTPPLFLLFLSAGLMLIAKPEWLTSLSFQLSFAATGGILFFYPYFLAKIKFKSAFLKMFFVSLSAQILTTPLLLITFREMSLFTLPINTLVAFLVEPIMLIGVLTSLIGNWLPLLNLVLNLILFGLLGLLNWIVNFCYPLSLWLQLRI